MKLLLVQWAGALNVIGFSFVMVFFLLVLIVLVLTLFGKIATSIEQASKKKAEKAQNLLDRSGTEKVFYESAMDDLSANELAAEEIAVIGLALYSYYSDVHDHESNILTVKKISKLYSPWSSKIYGLNVLTK
jgi:glutaconyl-CoA/methylmalonyl-CoA decarboxylase subunit delta